MIVIAIRKISDVLMAVGPTDFRRVAAMTRLRFRRDFVDFQFCVKSERPDVIVSTGRENLEASGLCSPKKRVSTHGRFGRDQDQLGASSRTYEHLQARADQSITSAHETGHHDLSRVHHTCAEL